MNHSSTKDYGSREPGWTCEDEIDCLRADLERAEKELVELRLLEMNHEGACVRLKAEVMSLRSALVEALRAERDEANRVKDRAIESLEAARRVVGRTDAALAEAAALRQQVQGMDLDGVDAVLGRARGLVGLIEAKAEVERLTAWRAAVEVTENYDNAALQAEVEATRAERDTALAHLENFKSVDRALSAILRKLAAIHRLHRL
jgi:hypothetical protein